MRPGLSPLQTRQIGILKKKGIFVHNTCTNLLLGGETEVGED
ncbi:hypothetical protein C900_02962 [Fulvivirga imtechensis AK7]|uniref:Uncharacterized protein n=1 Tax=Fulvivirga imtechensis AK7 TaxID=1237149 RepID=L8JSH7_9BACT|nr:hypothetical protein C900_02962 [Fulvivirga imtechensis AK7]